jgi:lysophospholipase L1-like esterase
MALTKFLLILVVLFFADVIIRYILIIKALFPIRHRPASRQRSSTLEGTGKKSIRIALLGDSVLYGENSMYPMPAIQYVARDLAKRYKTVTVDNYAISGDTIDQLIDKQLPKVRESDVVFIYIGANDYFRFSSLQKFSRSVDRLLEKLKGKTVIWCTLADPIYLYLVPLWQRYLFRHYATAYMEHVESVIRQHPEESWYTIDFRYEPTKRLKTQGLNSHSLIVDGFHLNDAGHELWVTIVHDAYIELKQKGAKLP